MWNGLLNITGKAQRTIQQRVSIKNMNLTNTERLNAIDTAIKQGLSNGLLEKANMLAKIIEMLDTIKNLENLTASNFENITSIIKDLGMKNNFKQNGFTHRYYTKAQYNKQSGMINTQLLINTANDNKEKPIMRLKTGNMITLDTLKRSFNDDEILDIQQNVLTPKIELIKRITQMVFNQDQALYSLP
jgi:hypothetical protein